MLSLNPVQITTLEMESNSTFPLEGNKEVLLIKYGEDGTKTILVTNFFEFTQKECSKGITKSDCEESRGPIILDL